MLHSRELKKPKINWSDYVGDAFDLAEKFCQSVEILMKEDPFLIQVYGFLASRSAELYIKATIIGYDNHIATYSYIRSAKHDLTKLLQKLTEFDSNATVLKPAIESLSKYSGDKVSYPEYAYEDGVETDFGSDEIRQLRLVRSYCKDKFDKVLR